MADRHCDALTIPIVGNRGNLDNRPRGAIFRQMQAVGGGAASHRAAEVDEIAIAIGARADHRIGEDDGVGFAPGDLLAEARPLEALIGRTGEGRPAAEFDMRPGAFRQYLDLHRPIFQKTAAYGHFGREEPEFTWEKTDRAEALKAAAGAEAATA